MELYKGNDFNGERYWEIIEAGATGMTIEEFNQKSACPLTGEEVDIFQWAQTAEPLDLPEATAEGVDAPLFMSSAFLEELEQRLSDEEPEASSPAKQENNFTNGPLFLHLLEKEQDN